jgi:hypothetical protein
MAKIYCPPDGILIMNTLFVRKKRKWRRVEEKRRVSPIKIYVSPSK